MQVSVRKLQHLPADASRKPAYICYLTCRSFPLNSISHSHCRFQGQSLPVDGGHCALICPREAPGAVHSPRAVWSRQTVTVALACLPGPHTLWDCRAGAAATGPGSLCQLVPDLCDSPPPLNVCCEGRQRWHEVLIRLLAPHPSEGVSDSSISCHAPVTAALRVPDVLFVILALLPEDRYW